MSDSRLDPSEAQRLRVLLWERRHILLINRCRAFRADGACAVCQMAQLIKVCILTMMHDDAF